MKSVTAVILILMVIPALPAADSTFYTSSFSLAQRNGPVVPGTASSVKVSPVLDQSGRRTDGGQGRQPVMLEPMVSKSSITTLLIVGAALVAGGVVLILTNDHYKAELAGLMLALTGGIVLSKGIQVLIFSGLDRRLARGQGSFQIAVKGSF